MHTKGPWKQRDERESFIRPAIVSEAGDLVALVNFYSDVPLIETAPDLLKACKDARDYIAEKSYSKGPFEMIALLDDVIAKAEPSSD